jgi:hypothetical protein
MRITINAVTNAEIFPFDAELVELALLPPLVVFVEFVYLTRKISPVASVETYNRPFASKASPTGLYQHNDRHTSYIHWGNYYFLPPPQRRYTTDFGILFRCGSVRLVECRSRSMGCRRLYILWGDLDSRNHGNLPGL